MHGQRAHLGTLQWILGSLRPLQSQLTEHTWPRIASHDNVNSLIHACNQCTIILHIS
jgi:hypothetical protein